MADGTLLGGKTALVTGASSGLGRHAALVLARAGASVVVAARRGELLEEVAGEIADSGGRARAVTLDLADGASIRDAVAAGEAALGPIDILLNNAGVSIQKWAVDYDEPEYDYIHDVNQKGAWLMAQTVGRRMIEAGRGGKVINVASMAAIRTLGQLSIYSMTKVALVQMTKSLALEWASHDIQVNCIAPGYIETPINQAYWRDERGRQLIKRLPRRRIGTPDVLDGALLLFASRQSDFVTGTVLPVEDGQNFM
ncbi:MAG: SDR family oxidoreductase [Alphaproteobacteria bacterium]|nr:SDR family oxidoreductase [Alphaproteobacteria bacterium]